MAARRYEISLRVLKNISLNTRREISYLQARVVQYCKNELLFLCSVLVLTHRFKNDLCVPCLFRLMALRTSSVAC